MISFLYKREMHRVINENTKEARMKDLDNLGFKDFEKSTDFYRLKSTPKSKLFFKILVLLCLKTPKLIERCKLDDCYETFKVLDK